MNKSSIFSGFTYVRNMSRIHQIDYLKPRVLHIYSGKLVVRLTSEKARFRCPGQIRLSL